ncbi:MULTISPECIES: molybdenum cofactor biosynthesis protein MoaE [unclassified Chelatococcus]|uniref:molybdenum cofactor biosynthesis protein MoaE n=1 Tax=unclassified Chelatococcus TaxID=2638111 RepID=UPI001BCCBAAA|nr:MULTISPECIES: molybdenum cofactor biosynthesis protein MoaE [unclassified Chelatococcus]MBS7697765.1 molybdenum cofactor biosynthesis protein MoaE [Chelatococcus sp. YT9]MBX3558378.1 molybdenum cofactor biosynthesis protein MoaE [Chelatococcus sp.]
MTTAGASIIVQVQREPFDPSAIAAQLTTGRTDIGAVVTFTGLCRDENGALAVLELEHYPGMAEEEIGRLVEEAAKRWPLVGLAVVHRFGPIRPGEMIVAVVTASIHRQAAFEAASFLMDYLKTSAPFWKKEHRIDGAETWVGARASDDQATDRWRSVE